MRNQLSQEENLDSSLNSYSPINLEFKIEKDVNIQGSLHQVSIEEEPYGPNGLISPIGPGITLRKSTIPFSKSDNITGFDVQSSGVGGGEVSALDNHNHQSIEMLVAPSAPDSTHKSPLQAPPLLSDGPQKWLN